MAIIGHWPELASLSGLHVGLHFHCGPVNVQPTGLPGGPLTCISRGRYITFQMAEVAILRQLFADILRLIAGLRPPPDPAPA